MQAKMTIRLAMLLCLTLVLSSCTRDKKMDGPSHFPEPRTLIEKNEPFSVFVLETRPKHGEVIVLSEEEAICVEIDLSYVAREGDNFSKFDNLNLWLDQKSIDKKPSRSGSLGGIYINENKDIVVPEEYFACWNVDYDQGIHLVTVGVWTSTNQEYFYHWAFEAVVQ